MKYINFPKANLSDMLRFETNCLKTDEIPLTQVEPPFTD